MEPFGILNFLQSLLAATDFSQKTPSSSPAPTPTAPMENQGDMNNTYQSETMEKSLNEQRKNAPYPETNSETQNAFTQFMSAHDARVKKTRDQRSAPNGCFDFSSFRHETNR